MCTCVIAKLNKTQITKKKKKYIWNKENKKLYVDFELDQSALLLFIH